MKSSLLLKSNTRFLINQLVYIFLLLSTMKVYSQNFDEIIFEKLDSQLEQYIADESPGIAVGIIKDGETVYEKYLGYANLEHKIKIDNKTRFNIASNAKQYTAVCILKLIEEGAISLNEDVRKYLPGLFENYEGKITILNLITHTSGIRDVYDLWALKGQTWWKLFIDNNDAINLLQSQTGLNFKPDTEYLYSNSNYILLAEIIKKITGEKFSSYAKNMFIDLRMKNTSFLTNYMKVIPHKARPYGKWGGWREYPSITEIHGDGALFTTLSDQLKWEKIIQLRDGQNIEQTIINKSQSIIPSSKTEEYGYGLMFGTYKNLKYTYHHGSTGAYTATFLRFVDKNLSIVVMSNNGNISSSYLAKQLADIVFDIKTDVSEVYQALPERIEKLKTTQDIIGNYQHEDGKVIKISENNGSIYREIYQQDPVKLISVRGGLFYYETNEDLKINFVDIGTPKQRFTIYLSTQVPSTYKKIQDSSFNKNDLNGRFYNHETKTEIIINYVEGDKYTITKNGRQRDAVLILKDYLRMMNSYKIKVIRDKDDIVIGLNVNNNRIKNVIFTKE